MTQILAKVDEKLTARNDLIRTELEERILRREQELITQMGGSVGGPSGGTAVSFTAINLLPGQTLYGSAVCYSEGQYPPGLVDSTDGTTLDSGKALVLNHLYMMTDQRGVTAAENVVLLVRGDYLVG